MVVGLGTVADWDVVEERRIGVVGIVAVVAVVVVVVDRIEEDAGEVDLVEGLVFVVVAVAVAVEEEFGIVAVELGIEGRLLAVLED